MKLMPPSSAASTIRIDSASSVGSPKFIAPRQSADTDRSVRPKARSPLEAEPVALNGRC